MLVEPQFVCTFYNIYCFILISIFILGPSPSRPFFFTHPLAIKHCLDGEVFDLLLLFRFKSSSRNWHNIFPSSDVLSKNICFLIQPDLVLYTLPFVINVFLKLKLTNVPSLNQILQTFLELEPEENVQTYKTLIKTLFLCPKRVGSC